jgi:signal transduction protein with GAF and PtsI domain
MVVSAEDFERALALVEQMAASMGRKRPRVGAMIETPSALFEIEDILTLADFVSVGTNDLTQFMIGAEGRTAGSLGDDSILQPAMLRALRHIAERASAQGRPVTVCGEAAGEPIAAAVLVGLGFRALSMSPARAARVRAAIRANRATDLAGLSREATALRSRERVARRVREALRAKQ